MANSDYTFTQVVNGTGYFSRSQDTGVSQGVKDLQTYLKKIGYTIGDTSGRFQADTEEAVKKFQAELAIGVDGSAGPKTCVRLNAARNSEYYTTYGKPLSNSQWGRTKILAGNIEDVDLLARIILAESGYKNIDDQKGVAIVLKNRSVNSSSKYWESASLYPQASIYARVVGKDGHYGTVDVGTTDAQTPMRGYYGGEEEGFVDPGWKNAVDLAKAIVNGTTISVSAYKVSGKTVTSTKMTINTTSHKKYLNQIAWDQYVSWYNKGTIDTTVQPLTFKSTSGANVICKST